MPDTVAEALVLGFFTGFLLASLCALVAWNGVKRLLVHLEAARQFATPSSLEPGAAVTFDVSSNGVAGALAPRPGRVMGRLRAMVGKGASATPDTEGAIDRKAMVARGVEELQAAAKAQGFTLSSREAKEMAADMISESGV